MPIVIVSKDQEITELVNQLFTVPRRGAVVSQAVQALIEANPHLEGTTRVAAGTPIVVPQLPDLTPKATAQASSADTWDQLATRAQQALTYAQSVIEDAAKNAQNEAKSSLELLRSREFRALAGQAHVDVQSLNAAVNKAAQEADAQSKMDLAGLDSLNRAVDEFVKTLGASSPTTGP